MIDRMTTERCRKLLGTHSSNLVDEEVVAIRDQMYELAGLVTDAYLDLKTEAVEFDIMSLNPNPDQWKRIVQQHWDLGWDIEGGIVQSWQHLGEGE
jgi:hypothetical protein